MVIRAALKLGEISADDKMPSRRNETHKIIIASAICPAITRLHVARLLQAQVVKADRILGAGHDDAVVRALIAWWQLDLGKTAVDVAAVDDAVGAEVRVQRELLMVRRVAIQAHGACFSEN